MTDTTNASSNPEVFEFDLGQINEAIANAPDAGFVNQNFGRLTAYPIYASWGKDASGNRVKTTRPMTRGSKAGPGESTEMFFKVDIAEFNPALTFAYERSVAVRKSTALAKSDWTEITEPSLIDVFGKDWTAKIMARPYVCVEDVANCNGAVSKKSNKVITVPKFIAVYDSVLECKAARDTKYAPTGDVAATVDAEMTAVVAQVKELLAAMGGDVATVHGLLTSQPPYNKFDADQLLAAANA